MTAKPAYSADAVDVVWEEAGKIIVNDLGNLKYAITTCQLYGLEMIHKVKYNIVSKFTLKRNIVTYTTLFCKVGIKLHFIMTVMSFYRLIKQPLDNPLK